MKECDKQYVVISINDWINILLDSNKTKCLLKERMEILSKPQTDELSRDIEDVTIRRRDLQASLLNAIVAVRKGRN